MLIRTVENFSRNSKMLLFLKRYFDELELDKFSDQRQCEFRINSLEESSVGWPVLQNPFS